MSSEAPLLDFDRLLAPVSDDRPSGESLQYSGLYDEIREARRADDVLEQGDWKRELKVADWDEAVALATDALLTKTKDLQVAAWLAEGLTMLHGFAGCARRPEADEGAARRLLGDVLSRRSTKGTWRGARTSSPSSTARSRSRCGRPR